MLSMPFPDATVFVAAFGRTASYLFIINGPATHTGHFFVCFYQETEFTLSEAKRNKIHTACRLSIRLGLMIYIIIVLLFMATQHAG